MPLLVFQAVVTAAEDIEREFEYAGLLLEEGFPDYAVIVAERVVAQHPELKDRANIVRAEALIAARRREQKTNGQAKSGGFCPQCGNCVQETDRFCPKCGEALT